MFKCFKNELFKLFTNRKIYILSGILAFLALVVAFYMKKTALRSPQGLESLNPQSFSASFLMEIGVRFIPILIIVLVSGMFSDEYRDETMKINLLAPVSRLEFLMSKVMISVSGVVFILFSTLVFSYLASLIFLGVGNEFTYNGFSYGAMTGILKTLLAYLLTTIPMSAFALVVLMFSELLDSSGTVVGLGLGLYIIEAVLQNVSYRLSTFMITAHFSSSEFVLLGDGTNDILQMTALSIIYISVAFLVMTVDFFRKDI